MGMAAADASVGGPAAAAAAAVAELEPLERGGRSPRPPEEKEAGLTSKVLLTLVSFRESAMAEERLSEMEDEEEAEVVPVGVLPSPLGGPT